MLRTILLLISLSGLAGLAPAQGGSTRTFGAGCPSGELDLGGWAPHPGLGALSIYGFDRQPDAPVVAFLGVSDSRWGPLTLPFPLRPLGLRGCTLYTDITVTQPILADGDGRVSASWPVPLDPSLAGGVLYGQCAGLQDPRVNPALPLTTSSAVELTIGPSVPFDGLTIHGDPRRPDGARWSYRSVDGGVPYDLAGKLWVPSGPPPPAGFPAVVISHGGGGSAYGYSTGIARHMVTWDMVCIAVNYTHSAEHVPLGSPGGRWENGGHPPNIARALKCVDILGGLGFVDMTRLAAHGNSNGGFVTTTLMAAAPGRFRAASHTSAGIDDARSPQWPSAATAARVATPYIVQHGDADTTVPLQHELDYVAILNRNQVPHRLVVWGGYGHEVGGPNSPVIGQVLANVRAFFRQHGVL